MNFGISSKQIWVKQDADLSTCSGCHCMIISAKYVLSVEMTAGTNKEVLPTSTELCQSCYDALKLNKQ